MESISDVGYVYDGTPRDEDELMNTLYKARDKVLEMWDNDFDMVDLEIVVKEG